MAVIPDVEARAVRLVCDVCGSLVMVTADEIRDPQVVRPVLVARGWGGSPFPAGAHHCPECKVVPERRAVVVTSYGDGPSRLSVSGHE